MGNTTAYEYDEANRQIKECMLRGAEETCATLYWYDQKGRVLRILNPLQEEILFTYDGNGNLTGMQEEDGRQTSVRYNLNNQPVSLSLGDGKEARLRYNKRGELIELEDWTGKTELSYDPLGRLAKVTDPMGRRTGYTYDPAGNLTGITYPGGANVTYGYDKNNRLVRAEDGDGQAASWQYDRTGDLISLSRPGSGLAVSYLSKGRPETTAYRLGDGTWQENRYRYDALGNRTARYVNGEARAACRYNVGNQLVERTEDGTTYDYRYDRRGNLTEERQGGEAAQTIYLQQRRPPGACPEPGKRGKRCL